MKESETDSGAAADLNALERWDGNSRVQIGASAARLPYRIQKQYLGELTDGLTLSELENMARFAGGDFALELKGERLHMFRVLVREVR